MPQDPRYANTPYGLMKCVGTVLVQEFPKKKEFLSGVVAAFPTFRETRPPLSGDVTFALAM